MICKFQHNGLCCNSGSMYYEYDCKNCECMIPITNAERIRSMTDEELVHHIGGMCATGYCLEEKPRECKRTGYIDGLLPCERCKLNWLKKPYKEET